MKNKFTNDGPIAIIDQSQNFISGYTNVEKFVNEHSIVFGDHTCTLKYVEVPFVQGADGVKILQVKDSQQWLNKYVFYVMKNFIVYDGEYRRHWSDSSDLLVDKISINKQNEVVEFLDKYEELIHDTNGLIPSQIEANNKQLKYYQNQLFSMLN